MDKIALTAIREVLPVLFRLEEAGRELASDREGPIRLADTFWLDDVARRIKDVFFRADYGRVPNSEFAESIMHAALGAIKGGEECMHTKKTKAECKVLNIDPDITILLERLDETSKSQIGRKCTWLFGEMDNKDYSFSALLNDLSSCVHSLADHWARQYGKLKVEGKCAWEE